MTRRSGTAPRGASGGRLGAAGAQSTDAADREWTAQIREQLATGGSVLLAGSEPVDIATGSESRLPKERVLLVEGAYEREFVSSFLSAYLLRLRKLRAESGRPLDELLGAPDALAERVLAATPLTPSPMEALTGPFYDTAGLRQWLGVTRQALDGRARARSLLALTTGDGSKVYPAWQFTSDGSTLPHLTTVLRTLATGIDDPWTWALWMTAPDDAWRDPDTDEALNAWQWLRKGLDPAPVLFEARADAARWAA